MTLQPQIVSLSGAGRRAPAASVLERNLRALGQSSPELVERLRAISPSSEIEFVDTPDGAASGTLGGRSLASRRRPLEEARRLAEAVDIKRAAVFAVTGFGMGHHVAALADRVGRSGIVVCFEPDLRTLRAVLERVDHAEWIARTNISFVWNPADAAALSAVLEGMDGLVAMGVRIVEHPASVERLGDSAVEFGATLTRIVAAVRTHVLTTMVQTEITVRNLAMNADRYVAAPGIEDLKDSLKGRPAVVVSAGPSLARNMALLAEPGVRDRVCIIAVQTTLKTLLNAGIRPHFVVALDHHEISRRFYEGLTAEDVEGVTLVVEAKGNPSILDAWPGAFRMPKDAFLDALLGEGLTNPDRGAIKPGATVAHLAHYLARHMGCDPVALVGQDLGFTDGQYYAANAAIHRVWSGELNEFVSLELLEWHRIVRMRSILRKVEAITGEPMYTDEQMATYLAQFERDFLADAQRGLTVVDATEGGVRKMHTTPSTLAAFLAKHATGPLPSLPRAERRTLNPRETAAVIDRLREVRQGVWRVARSCKATEGVLAQMLEHHEDQQRVNRLIDQAQRLADETRAIGVGYTLTQKFNQTGVFNRAREDRSISLDDLDPLARQRRQIERDRRNVEWLHDAAEALGALLDASSTAVQTGVRPARDISAPTTGPGRTEQVRSTTVAAVLFVDSDGPAARDIAGAPALVRTLQRLQRCARLDAIALVTPNPDAVRALLANGAALPDTVIVPVDPGSARVPQRIRAGRAWARTSWRGGLAGLTVYDELINPALAAAALEQVGAHAALLLGADWPLVDPSLCDAVIERHEESPEHHRLVFTQAPPGLAGCVVDSALLREIAQGAANGAPLASIGGLLAYNPRKPRADAIAKPICVQIDAALRDLHHRFIADTDEGAALCALQVDHLRDLPALLKRSSATTYPSIATVIVDDRTSVDSLRSSLRGCETNTITLDARGAHDRAHLLALAHTAAKHIGGSGGAGGAGVGKGVLHLRIEPSDDPAADARLLECAPAVVSVEMHADSAGVFLAATGRDGFPGAIKSLEALANAAAAVPFDHRPWIVPRMTKTDAVLADVESFVDKWTLVFGHAAIDARSDTAPNQRIKPLPIPACARERFARETRTIDLRGGAR